MKVSNTMFALSVPPSCKDEMTEGFWHLGTVWSEGHQFLNCYVSEVFLWRWETWVYI